MDTLFDVYFMVFWWLFHGYFLLCIPNFQTHRLFHRWTHLLNDTTDTPGVANERRATKGQEIAPLFLASVGSTRIMSPCTRKMAIQELKNWSSLPYGAYFSGLFFRPNKNSLYGTNVALFYNVEPPSYVCCFINPIHYSYKYHKP